MAAWFAERQKQVTLWLLLLFFMTEGTEPAEHFILSTECSRPVKWLSGTHPAEESYVMQAWQNSGASCSPLNMVYLGRMQIPLCLTNDRQELVVHQLGRNPKHSYCKALCSHPFSGKAFHQYSVYSLSYPYKLCEQLEQSSLISTVICHGCQLPLCCMTMGTCLLNLAVIGGKLIVFVSLTDSCKTTQRYLSHPFLVQITCTRTGSINKYLVTLRHMKLPSEMKTFVLILQHLKTVACRSEKGSMVDRLGVGYTCKIIVFMLLLGNILNLSASDWIKLMFSQFPQQCLAFRNCIYLSDLFFLVLAIPKWVLCTIIPLGDY